MPTYRLPTDTELELANRFTVNKNYLQSLAGFIEHEYRADDGLNRGLARGLREHRAFQRIRGDKQADVVEVERWLTLGWASEVQLHLPATMGIDAMIGFSNAWAPVHAYYAVYGVLQAWFAANGMAGLTNDHTGTLKTIGVQLRDRELLPPPWGLLAEGCPMRGEKLHLNAPTGADCEAHVEALATPPNGLDPLFWARYSMWLRTSRKARLVKRESEWKADNARKQIPAKQRTKFADSLGPTSLFDCLWRLRIRSNYGSVEPFLVPTISEADHIIFSRSLRVVTHCTVALLEQCVARRIGRAEFGTIAAGFVDRDRSGLTDNLLARRLTVIASPD